MENTKDVRSINLDASGGMNKSCSNLAIAKDDNFLLLGPAESLSDGSATASIVSSTGIASPDHIKTTNIVKPVANKVDLTKNEGISNDTSTSHTPKCVQGALWRCDSVPKSKKLVGGSTRDREQHLVEEENCIQKGKPWASSSLVSAYSENSSTVSPSSSQKLASCSSSPNFGNALDSLKLTDLKVPTPNIPLTSSSSKRRSSRSALSSQKWKNIKKSTASSQSAPTISHIDMRPSNSAPKKRKRKWSRRRRKRDAQSDVFGDIVIKSGSFRNRKKSEDYGFGPANKKRSILQLQYDEQIRLASIDKRTITDLRKQVRVSKEKLRRLEEKTHGLTKPEIVREENARQHDSSLINEKSISAFKDDTSSLIKEEEKIIVTLKELLAGLVAGKGVTKQEVRGLSKEMKDLAWLLEVTRDENEILVNKLKAGEENYHILRSNSGKEIRELKGNFKGVLKENEQLRLTKQRSLHFQECVKKLEAEIKILKGNKSRNSGQFLSNQGGEIENLNKEIIRLKHESKRAKTIRSRQTWSQSELTNLRQRVRELEGLINNMNHESLANIIQKCKPSNANELVISSLKFQLKDQQDDQGKELTTAHQTSERIFRRLRSQNRKLKQKLKSIRIDSFKVREEALFRKQENNAIQTCREKYQELAKTLKEERKPGFNPASKISRSCVEGISLRKKTSSSSRGDSVKSVKVPKLKREKVGLKPNLPRRIIKNLDLI